MNKKPIANDQMFKAIDSVVDKAFKKIEKNALYRSFAGDAKFEIASKSAKAEVLKAFAKKGKLPQDLARLFKEIIAIKKDQLSLASRVRVAAAVGESEGGPVAAVVRAIEQMALKDDKKKQVKKKTPKKSSAKKIKSKKKTK